MALDGDALGLAIAQTILGKSTIPPTPGMIANIQEFWKDIAAVLVGHIQDNAEVPAGISVQVDPNSGKGATDGPGNVR